jgi:hypothetical protein
LSHTFRALCFAYFWDWGCHEPLAGLDFNHTPPDLNPEVSKMIGISHQHLALPLIFKK